MVTLLGRNGAGKTTTLQVDHGHRRPARRLGALRGPRADRPAVERDRAAGIAFCPEERGIFASLDVEENLLLPPRGEAGRPDARRASSSCSRTSRSGCAARAPSSPAASSRCWRSARILRTGARLLLLDEPTEGLAPVIIQQIGKTIRTLKEQGFTILLVEQNFRFASTVADRYYVMEHGRVVESFANAELDANLEKLHEYLGV